MNYTYKNNYFVLRHGEATYNVRRVVTSKISEASDEPSILTDIGKKQARDAAEKLAKESIDYIYSSPYKRAMHTASIVAEKLGLSVIRDDRLREVDVGALDGITYGEYQEHFRGIDRLTHAVEGGESLIDLRNRMKEFIDDMEEKYSHKNILVVSHGDPIWMLESTFRGAEGKDILKIPYLKTGEFKVFG